MLTATKILAEHLGIKSFLINQNSTRWTISIEMIILMMAAAVFI